MGGGEEGGGGGVRGEACQTSFLWGEYGSACTEFSCYIVGVGGASLCSKKTSEYRPLTHTHTHTHTHTTRFSAYAGVK